MKSGNVIQLKGIKGYNIEYSGDDIRSLRLIHYGWLLKPRRRLIVPTINLSQIEAITRG